MIDTIVGFLNGLLLLNRKTEAVLIDLISSLSPWICPILPAYITGSNLYSVLNYPVYIAVICALVIETIGLSSMSTILLLWSWNETKREKDPSAPVGLAIISGVLYISVVLSVNVLLEINPLQYKILVNGLMSLMTVVAALIIAVRGQHSRRLEEIAQERKERKEERLHARQVQVAPQLAQVAKWDWRELSIDEKIKISKMTQEEVMNMYAGIPESTSRHWLKLAKENGFHEAKTTWVDLPIVDRNLIANMDKYEIMKAYLVDEPTALEWKKRSKYKETIQ